jgi:hypothetical protein
VPFFFKQWGGATPKAGGRELEGQLWDGMPHSAGQESRQPDHAFPGEAPVRVHRYQPAVL